MNYELAKQLKEAGFPQKGKGHISSKGKEFKYEHIAYGDDLYFPTLSELIEVCGDRFGSLMRWSQDLSKFKKREWLASEEIDFGCKESGSTPEEAVAKLWLELNKKRE